MLHFSQLVTELDQTNSTNAKVAAMVRFLEVADDRDKVWMMALFSQRRPRRGVKTSLLREWVSEVSSIPLWLVEESYHVVGDLAETLALLLPPPDLSPEDKSLAAWMEQLKTLSSKDDEEKKAFIMAAWQRLDKQERFVFHKLITGGFRLGVSQKLLVRALSSFTGQDRNAIAHRLMGQWTPETATFHDLLLSEDIADDLSRPYPFFLAYPVEDDPQESLGDIGEWQAEWKWDGIRSQLIKRGGEAWLWSRGEELITEKFPELQPLLEQLPDGTVIDGELLPFREHPLPFQLLQTRIGRKHVAKKHLKEAPCLILAYDLMEWEGQDVREQPLQRRRERLKQLVLDIDMASQLRMSETLEADSWKALAEGREIARDMYAEGLMLKRKNSAYQVGRKRGDWWKWKVDPLTVDAVMIYAQRGHGRRANLFSDYTFAVWDGKDLVPVAKAYSGLTDAEMRQVDAWIKQNTLERFGPVRSVRAELVFEIGFEGINWSKRHKSGVALRFPRMLRLRQDKKPAEADQLAFLRGLIRD